MLILLLLTFGYIQVTLAGFRPCLPCRGPQCEEKPRNCNFGEARDPCGRWACAKGPNEICGNAVGSCGKGMTCKCGRCRGCSIDALMNRGFADCTPVNAPTCLEHISFKR